MLPKTILLLADVFAIVCLARFILQWAKLSHSHPLAHFYSQTTDRLVSPLRKIVPPFKQWDSACILAPILIYYICFTVLLLLGQPESIGIKSIAANLLLTLLYLSKAGAYVLLFGLVLRMIISFSKPYGELLPALQRIFMPLTQAFSMLRIGRYDFSGSVIAIILWLWLTRLVPALIIQLNMWILQ